MRAGSYLEFVPRPLFCASDLGYLVVWEGKASAATTLSSLGLSDGLRGRGDMWIVDGIVFRLFV